MSADEHLLEQVRLGSVEAFGELYRRYCDRAYRVAWWVCYDHQRTEEAVQDTFMAVWHSQMPSQPDGSTVAAWLLTRAHYRAREIARQHARDEGGRDSKDTPKAHFVSRYDQNASNRETGRVGMLLNLLPHSQQEVITLAFYGNLTHTEIAAALGLPADTVKGRMRLGLQALGSNLEREVA